MTPEQFCYWLQGYAELNESGPTPEQWKAIKEHLQTVFKKVTPPVIQGLQYCPAPSPGGLPGGIGPAIC